MTNKYSRRFVALKQEHGDYTLKGREAAGKCIVEMNGERGKVIFSVQNLKSEILYKPFLVCSDNSGSLGIPAGSLRVDEKGKGELRFECEASNVLNSGKSLDEFNVMAIIFLRPEGMIVPLAGYTGEEIAWKNNFIQLSDKQKTEIEKGLDLAENTAPNLFQEKPESEPKDFQEKIEEVNENIKEKIPEEIELSSEVESDLGTDGTLTGVMPDADKCIPCDDIQNISAPAADIKEEAAENTVFESKPIPEIKLDENAKIWDFYDNPSEYPDDKKFKEAAVKVNNSLQEISDYSFLKGGDNHEKENSLKVTGETKLHSNIEFILSKNTKMNPFSVQKKEIQWIRISTKELIYLPERKWAYMNDPFVIKGFKKYNHLILGYYEEHGKKELYLGVPDIFEQRKEYEAKNSGFLQFKCCEEGEGKEGRHGYWLLNIVL